MAVSYVDFSADTVSSGNVSTAKPTGIVVGDILVAALVYYGSTGVTWTPPDGFQSLDSDGILASSYQVFWKVATQTDVDATTFTFIPAIGGYQRALLIAINGATGTTPIHNEIINGATNSSATTGVTPSAQNSLLLLLALAIDDDVTTSLTFSGYSVATDDPSWTERHDDTSFSLNIASAFATAVRSGATATGNSNITATPDTGNLDVFYSMLLAFAPGAYRVSVTGASATVTTGSASLTRYINLINNTAKPSTTINNTARP